MDTSVLSMLNVTLGTAGISSGGTAVSDNGISFGDVLSQTVNTAVETAPVEAQDIADAAEDAENVTFAQLTSELKEEIAEAGEDVIKAAVEMLKTVGKAVELLMGTSESGETDEDETNGDVTSVFGMLLSIMPQKGDELTAEEQAADIIDKIADAIEAGTEEELAPLEIVKKVVKSISPEDSDDEDLEAFANALLDILSSITGIDRGDTFEFPETEVTEFSVEKLGGILKETVSDKAPEDIAKAVEDIIKAPEQQDKNVVKFADFLSRPETGRSIADARPVLKIMDAAVQLNVIRGGEHNAESIAADIAPESTETDVYSELWTYASRQLTEKLVEEISSPISEGVKELTVVLKPESLGEIAVKLSQDSDGRISVVMAASNPEIGRAITENAYALTEGLNKQNVSVDSVNVINPGEAAEFMGLDFTNRSFDRRNGEQGGGNRGSARNSSAVEEIGAADDIRAQRLLKEAKLWATA